MKEDFLHYLWSLKKFDTQNLKTTRGETISILHSGQYLQLAGPDFFNAQLIIGEQKWAGNVEIHLKSSDWYVHNHEKDPAYENVILHVVWEHDIAIFRENNTEIPVLELKNYVSKASVNSYQALVSPKSWIFCESQIHSIDSFVFQNWQERIFFERLERKSKAILELLTELNSDWEAVLFCLLARNFGLNTNGELFLKMAKSIPFSIIRKENSYFENLEALFFTQVGLLENDQEDIYFQELINRRDYLFHKYQLEKTIFAPAQFFKHRPDNFPTIRLSQLANLYWNRHNLFSNIIELKTMEKAYQLFQVGVSVYWENHYQFDSISPKKKKAMSKSFIDLICINTIIPLQFAFAKSQGKEIAEELLQLLKEIRPESNSIINKFNTFGITAKNAFESQSLLQLKNEYCQKSRCLECAIGVALLKNN